MNLSEHFCDVAVDMLGSVIDEKHAKAIGQIVIARDYGVLQQKVAQHSWCSATVDRCCSLCISIVV
jgi:hypothetical protein